MTDFSIQATQSYTAEPVSDRDELSTAGSINLLRESLDILDRQLASLFDRVAPALLPEGPMSADSLMTTDPAMSPLTMELTGIRRQVESMAEAVARTYRRVSL